MIVFDLRCGASHAFEAWFASSSAFNQQVEAGQILCPFCGSSEIAKAVMAPRLTGSIAETPQNKLSKLVALQREMLRDSQWVGGSFANRARDMAEGRADPATIHGTATSEEALSLRDDGIAVLPLPFPVVPPEKRN